MGRCQFAAALLLASTAAIVVAAPRFPPWGLTIADMNTKIAPGEDFFAYVNGTWLAKTRIAPDQVSAGVRETLTDQAERDVRAIAETEAARPDSQIGSLYAAWMDEGAVEKAGAAALKPYLAKVAEVTTKTALVHLFVQPAWSSPALLNVQVDQNHPDAYTITLEQGGLGLPSRDYYLLPDQKYGGLRTAYRAYLERLFGLAGYDDAAGRAARVLALETALARTQWTPERTRDVVATNNPMTVARLQALSPQFDWPGSLKAAGFASPVATVLVSEPSAIAAAGHLIERTPLQDWKDYLAVHFVSDHAAYLPRAFSDARFTFYDRALNDQPEQAPRWKRGVALVDRMLGEAVGRLYVEKHYPPGSGVKMAEMVDNLRAAFGSHLRNLKWMDGPTKAQALAKLATIDPRIGHPPHYIDYSSYRVTRGDLLGDVVRGKAFKWRYRLSIYPKPVDRALWPYLLPQTVDAYYDAQLNQITFAAALLQAPYFDPQADPAVNYGAIGAVIGHEMGHGFDDQGRLYDAQGRLRDWWTPESTRRFKALTAALGKQYDAYEPIPGVHVNGALTMGENVGDLGGIETAWGAWRRYVTVHGDPGVRNGFTADQRFLLAYAYSWQYKERDGALRARLLSDTHSPPRYRVNGIVRNFDPWYAAFPVKPGQKLYLPPAQRVHIWTD